MFIEYYRKRRATIPNAYVFLLERGVAVELKLKEPIDIPDNIAYKILARDGDIVRQVDAPISPEEKEAPKKKAKSKQVKNYKNK
jgi:hypothetical protein